MSEERKGQKRLAVFLPTEIHKELKHLATERGTTITNIVLRAIIVSICEMNKYKLKE